MKKITDSLKTIAINLISNIIYQIIIWIVVAISASGVLYAFFNSRISKLTENNISISILDIIVFLSIIFILGGVIVLIIRYKRNSPRNGSLNGITSEEGYYFTDSEKNVTIYRNGQGIILHRSIVIVTDIDKFTQLRRRISVKDGVKTLKFPSLEVMLKSNKDKRFTDFGFWYKSDNNIISEVKEYYWDHSIDPSSEDVISKNDPQELRWYFAIDKNKIEKEKPYEIYYIMAVPGLAALKDGLLDPGLLKDSSQTKKSSSMKITRHMKQFKYIVSFEAGIELAVEPTAKCVIERQDGVKELDIPGTIEYNLFYKKYIFDIPNPIFGSNIVVSWKYNTL